MSPTLNLTRASPEEVNAMVAEHVAGYIWLYDTGHRVLMGTPVHPSLDKWNRKAQPYKTSDIGCAPNYVNDPGAVLALLAPHLWDSWRHIGGDYSVRIPCNSTSMFGRADTFCRAAVIALLRAAGVTVTEG